MVTGSRKRTTVFGCLLIDLKQLVEIYEKFNSITFVDYHLKKYRKDLVNLLCL